ncbi:hypothetical protein [Microvirga roseola]|uniref:hypothetical protein n=1 Tax=Microvirga roseola TaxID=2883126 RepID=UPI001E4810FD|nr:hypothetical protein [Microvirga roseola]
MRKFLYAVAAFALLTMPVPAIAQQNLGGSLSQDRQGGSGQSTQAETAQVGAGTTNGTTTGYSGPKDSTSDVRGENTLPPLPGPQLCDAYRDQPFYQSCLWVTLRN